MDQAEKFNWRITDVADYLGKPVSWVYDNFRRRGIPFTKVGQGIRFRPREVSDWAEAQRVSTP
jgi:excisionase family DNA binding protein